MRRGSQRAMGHQKPGEDGDRNWNSAFCQAFLQLLNRSLDAAFHSFFIHAQNGTNLAQPPIFEIMKQHRATTLFTELTKRVIDEESGLVPDIAFPLLQPERLMLESGAFVNPNHFRDDVPRCAKEPIRDNRCAREMR